MAPGERSAVDLLPLLVSVILGLSPHINDPNPFWAWLFLLLFFLVSLTTHAFPWFPDDWKGQNTLRIFQTLLTMLVSNGCHSPSLFQALIGFHSLRCLWPGCFGLAVLRPPLQATRQLPPLGLLGFLAIHCIPFNFLYSSSKSAFWDFSWFLARHNNDLNFNFSIELWNHVHKQPCVEENVVFKFGWFDWGFS